MNPFNQPPTAEPPPDDEWMPDISLEEMTAAVLAELVEQAEESRKSSPPDGTTPEPPIPEWFQQA
jgi:hypothetical protein